jgi:hypothetical protein
VPMLIPESDNSLLGVEASHGCALVGVDACCGCQCKLWAGGTGVRGRGSVPIARREASGTQWWHKNVAHSVYPY